MRCFVAAVCDRRVNEMSEWKSASRGSLASTLIERRYKAFLWLSPVPHLAVHKHGQQPVAEEGGFAWSACSLLPLFRASLLARIRSSLRPVGDVDEASTFPVENE